MRTRLSILLPMLIIASGIFAQQSGIKGTWRKLDLYVDTAATVARHPMDRWPEFSYMYGGLYVYGGDGRGHKYIYDTKWGGGIDSIVIGDYENNQWLPSIFGISQDTTWKDTCVYQTWKIQVGLNQFALKDTTYCFKYPVVNGGGPVVTDTIWITNNVMYQGKQGVPGPQGPPGPRGATGDCSNCPSGGGGGDGLFETGFVNVVDYGAVPNDGVNDDVAFAAASEDAIRKGYRKIFIPAGEFNINFWNATKPPQGLLNNFAPIVIVGAGRADEGAPNEKFTKIKCGNKSGPCITANAFRLAEISNFVMEGNNYSKCVEMSSKCDTVTWRAENWVAAGNSIDKFQHQSGLALDYGQSSAPWAAQGLFDKLKINGFVVGISISPSSGVMQNDTYYFRDIKLEGVVYGVSIGQDQCRSITFENVWMNMGYCAYVNNRFGRSNGSAFNVLGGQYTSLFKLFECTNAYRGQMAVTGLFAEAVGIIGSISGLGINTNSVAFTGCEIGLDDDGWFNPRNGVWITPFAAMSAGGNMVFTGCNIHSKKKTIAFSGNQYIFSGTTFTDTYPVFPNDWATVSITGRPLFDFQKQITDRMDVSGNSKKYGRYGVSEIKVRGRQSSPYTYTSGASVMVPYWGTGVWLSLPETSAKEFEWPIPANDTKWYKVGDYIDCQSKANVISGMPTDFGQAMIPGLEVMQVKSASLVLRRVSPEIRVESWYKSGQVYTEPYLWVAGSEIQALSSGAEVKVSNAGLLAPGDYVHSSGIIARVISVTNDMVKFNVPVSAGMLTCISY